MIMLTIWIVVGGLLAFLIGDITGIVLGVVVGYFISSQVIQRFPGFWKR